MRQIGKGDFELLTVARVRGRRAVDFLQPMQSDKDAYQRVVTNATNSTSDGPDQVAAVLRVFNRRGDAEGSRSHLLRLTFENGSSAPTSTLVPLGDGGDRPSLQVGPVGVDETGLAGLVLLRLVDAGEQAGART